jgi:hypothetical protein
MKMFGGHTCRPIWFCILLDPVFISLFYSFSFSAFFYLFTLLSSYVFPVSDLSMLQTIYRFGSWSLPWIFLRVAFLVKPLLAPLSTF